MKGGFTNLLDEGSAKAVDAALAVPSQLSLADERIAELRWLCKMGKVSLPDEAVTYDIANDLEEELREKGKFEETKVIHLAALEGRRVVLGEKNKDTLASGPSFRTRRTVKGR